MGPKVALLQSFPTPPSFMPPSPTSAAHPLDASTFSVTANPPLSSPPTGPLPPVPGRSRISEHEAALILQSRRNSRHSDYSSSSGRPDSVASFASAKSNAAGYTGSIHNHRDDNRERRWLSRTVRTPAVQVTAEISEDTNQAYGGLRIDGEDGQDVLLTSLRFTVSSLPPSPTDSEHDLVIPPALSTQFPTPPPLSPFAIQQASAMWKASSSTGSSPLKLSAPPSPFSAAPRAASGSNPNESLAEISMHDLPSPDDGAESEWDVPTTRPTPVRRSSQLSSQPLPSFIAPTSESRNGLRRMARISVDNFDSVSLRASLISPTLSNSSPLQSTPPASFPFPSAMPPLPSASVKDVDTELHKSLHRELRSARSRSRSHRERLNSGSSSQAASPQPFESADSPVPPVPAVFPTNSHSLPRRKESLISSVSTADTKSQTSGDGRISPDIQNLLERTPRPRRSMSSVRSQGRSSAGASRASSKASMRRRTSDHASIEKEWEEFSASRGRTSQRHLPHSDEKEARLLKLERELDGGGSESEGEDHRNSYGDGFGFGALRDGESDSEASDSSLDLHTPLPNLMLRHGLLSPNSKLLSSSTSIDSLASFATGGHTINGDSRPGSKMSMISDASTQTKSGLFKDTRDTNSRRQRHKDGRLLKGGIGLTTGLGWSDSEDEGAPSALTRRISSLNLTKQPSSASLNGGRARSKSYGNLRTSASMSSVSRPSTRASSTRASTFSSGSGPLSRSYSSRALNMDLDEVDEIGEFGEINTTQSQGKTTIPPSSWLGTNRASTTHSTSNLIVKTSGTSFKGGDRTPNRITRSISETSMRSSVSEAAVRADDYTLTPSSTSSSLSIPFPATPRDGDPLDTPTPSRSNLGLSRLDLDKGLPSLPNPKTGSIRRPSGPNSIKKSSLKKPSASYSSHPLPFDRHNSSTQSLTSMHTASTRSLKQLQLPRQQLTMSVNGQLPVPVPGVGSRPTTSPTTLSSPPTPTSPGYSASDPAKPKSRVGTGMAYRNSPSSSSRMRMPSTKMPVVDLKF